jgi:hypothetical protein
MILVLIQGPIFALDVLPLCVNEIRRLRVVAQSLAQEVAGSGDASAESTEEKS